MPLFINLREATLTKIGAIMSLEVRALGVHFVESRINPPSKTQSCSGCGPGFLQHVHDAA